MKRVRTSPTARTAKPTPRDVASAHKPQKQKKLTGKARTLSSKLAYQGNVFSVYTDQVEEPGGVRSRRDVIRHNGSVVILGVDDTRNPADPDLLLIRQYRHAAGQFLLELPAGRLEKGERPVAGARREMIEETGFTAKKWTRLTRYYASPGFLGEWMEIWLATGVVAGEAHPEEDERIELRPTPLSKVLEMIEAGKIHDGKTLIGTLLYARQHALQQTGRSKTSRTGR